MCAACTREPIGASQPRTSGCQTVPVDAQASEPTTGTAPLQIHERRSGWCGDCERIIFFLFADNCGRGGVGCACVILHTCSAHVQPMDTLRGSARSLLSAVRQWSQVSSCKAYLTTVESS